jgi:hypothetical protein
VHQATRLWHRIETIHAVTYFAPEPGEAYAALGLRGFWMGYFAGRAAPMGAVEPGVVTATFFNFHPDKVARALPDAWAYAGPADVLAARAASAAAALRARVAGIDELARGVHGLLAEVIDAAVDAGRPLFAANRAVDVGEDPVAQLWQQVTTLREHRGDGHVAALTSHGLDGCAAHVLTATWRGIDEELMRESRGWRHEEWFAAKDRLWLQGWLDDDGDLTDAGRAARVAIERRTDDLAISPYGVLGDRVEALVDALTPIRDAVLATGTIRFPNPMAFPESIDES